MDLQELKKAVAAISQHELHEFSQWLERFLADGWDRKIEANDAAASDPKDSFGSGSAHTTNTND